MKIIIICVCFSILGLTVWTYFWAGDLIVCRLASTESVSHDWELLRIDRETNQTKGLLVISDLGWGWKGLGEMCWAPALLLWIAMVPLSYSMGYLELKWKIEEDYRVGVNEYVRNSEEYARSLREKAKKERIQLKQDKKKFLQKKEEFEYFLEYYKKEAENAGKQLENERRGHNNRKDKMSNLEKKLKKMEAEKLAGEREKLALERENLTLLKKKSELETRLRQLAGKRS